ncbi:hypothetical protein EJQ95_13915 [Salmonella enterica]|nr:hypothetical protein [Salmonella enterica]
MACHTLLRAKGSNFIAGRSSLRCVRNHIRSPGSHKGMRQRIPLLLQVRPCRMARSMHKSNG